MKQAANNSILKAFRILDVLAEVESELGLTEISRRLGWHKSTVYRFLASLEAVGAVQKNPVSGKYRLGLAMFELGNRVPAKRSFADKIHPYLRDLAMEVNEVVNLAGLFQNEVVYLDKIESRRSIQIRTFVGFHVMPHCTALGKAILAELDQEELERILRTDGLPRLTARTITDRRVLAEELERTRKRGYAFDDGEFEEGLRCLAVTLHDRQGKVTASISISAPASRMTSVRRPKLLAALRATRRRIEEMLHSVSKTAGEVWR